MNMKKNISLLLLISILFGIISLSGCKKGPNDPFISLKSRKARVVGDWIIAKYKYETTTNFIDGQKRYYLLEQDGENIKETIGQFNNPNYVDTTWTWDGVIITERMLNFDKNGKVVLKWHYKIDEYYPDPNEDASIIHDTILSYERIYQNTGTWNFLYNVDEYKKKERLTIMWEYVDFEQIYNIKAIELDQDADDPQPIESNISQREQTRSYYYNGELTETWTIDKLKNKEMMMYRNIDNNKKYSLDQSEIENTTVKGLEQYDLEQE
jgi:hypothetical protein